MNNHFFANVYYPDGNNPPFETCVVSCDEPDPSLVKRYGEPKRKRWGYYWTFDTHTEAERARLAVYGIRRLDDAEIYAENTRIK